MTEDDYDTPLGKLTSCSECNKFERRSHATGWCSRQNKLVFNASACFEGTERKVEE
jgi:hypothetical protein